jgi:hypothetical protein
MIAARSLRGAGCSSFSLTTKLPPTAALNRACASARKLFGSGDWRERQIKLLAHRYLKSVVRW